MLTNPSPPGATLSQLSDSGQTLSEDSGVDIAEAGGFSKDGSPRPSKNHRTHLEQPGFHALSPGIGRQVRVFITKQSFSSISFSVFKTSKLVLV